MTTQTFALLAVGVLIFALFSRRLQDRSITPPMVFGAFGLIIGQAGLGVADFSMTEGFAHILAELTLILVLFIDAARIDVARLKVDHDLPVRMLAIGMPLTIILGAGAALLLFSELTLWHALVLAAILAPTDAALGQAVVSSPQVPVRIRQALNVESGLNDGVALPAVLLFACFAGIAHGGPTGTAGWIQFGILQLTLGPLVGLAIGYAGARGIDTAVSKGWMAGDFTGPAALALALACYSLAELVGGNGFIAAFVGGLAFGVGVRDHCHSLFEFAEAEGQLLTLIAFLLFGAVLLPEALGHLSVTTVVYAVLSLTVIRMVPVAISLLGMGLKPQTVGFIGWFGPRGLASLLFVLLVLEDVHAPGAETVMITAVTTVALSTLLHGLSASPGARWYARVVGETDGNPEHMAVQEMRTRVGSWLAGNGFKRESVREEQP